MGATAGGLMGNKLGSSLDDQGGPLAPQQTYQAPPPPPPANTHGLAASGMSSDPSTSGMNIDQKSAVTPRQQIEQAIMKRKSLIPALGVNQ